MDPEKFSEIALQQRTINNPLGLETIDRIIALCDPPPGCSVLDVGCGKGALLVRLAEGRELRGEGIDLSRRAIETARARAQQFPLRGRLRFVCGDAGSLGPPAEPYFLAVCLGATQAFGGLRGALSSRSRWTRPGGWVVVGEGFWRRPPESEYLEVLGARPDELNDDLGNLRAGQALGLTLAAHWSSTEAEWDDFEDAYLEGIERYARANPDDPDVPEMLRRIRRWRDGYVRWGRNTLGFGVYAFRTNPSDPGPRT